MIERGAGRQVERLEAVGREDAGAVHGIADAIVLFACERPQPPLRETRSHEQSTWAGAHDEDV